MRNHDELFERHSRRVMRLGCALIAFQAVVGIAFVAALTWAVVAIVRHFSGAG